MTSVAEAETEAVFSSTKNIIHFKRILEELGHPQPPTPLKYDNRTTVGVSKNLVRPSK